MNESIGKYMKMEFKKDLLWSLFNEGKLTKIFIKSIFITSIKFESKSQVIAKFNELNALSPKCKERCYHFIQIILSPSDICFISSILLMRKLTFRDTNMQKVTELLKECLRPSTSADSNQCFLLHLNFLNCCNSSVQFQIN